MPNGKKRIGELHAEHQQWLTESSFYADELKIFGQRLTEVAHKNTKPEITMQLEHFQNQFIIQKEQLDILNHDTKVHEQALAHFAEEHPVAVDHRLFENHDEMLEKAAAFKKLFTELKKDFNAFLSTTM